MNKPTRPQPFPASAQQAANSRQMRTPPTACRPQQTPKCLQPKAAGLRQPPLTRQQPQPPAAPPAYRPQPSPGVLQRSMAQAQTLRQAPRAGLEPAAPSASRPGRAPGVIQDKASSARQCPPSGRPPQRPVPPPVYRPVPQRVLQPKSALAAQAHKPPRAPAVYRPQPTPRVLQTKCPAGQQPRQARPCALPAAARPRPASPAQATWPPPPVRTATPGHVAQLRAGHWPEGRGVGAGSSRPQRPQCGPDTQRRGVVQRKFTFNGEKAQDFLNLIKYNSTQKDKISTVEQSNELNVDVKVSQSPPPQLNDEILGVTLAVIETNTTPVILNGSVGLNKHTLPGQLKSMKGMEIFVELYENFPSTGGPQQVPQSRQIFSMVHEFERHVFPFVDLYTSINMAKFNSDVLSDETDFATLSNELLKDVSSYGAVAQHVSPELAARTRLTQENILNSLEQAATSHEEMTKVNKLREEMTHLLQQDTQGRGVNMTAMEQQYQTLKSKQT